MKLREVKFIKVHQSVMSVAGREMMSFRKMSPGEVPAYPQGMTIWYLVDEQAYLAIYGENDHAFIHATNVIECEYTNETFTTLLTEMGIKTETVKKKLGRPSKTEEQPTAA